MKSAILAIVMGFSCVHPLFACHIDPNPVWTLTGFQNPESAYYDSETDTIYLSNVAGDATAKDGNGFISTLSPDGKVKKLFWIGGLDGPKGIRIFKGKLYVSDIHRVVVIDIAKRKILKKIVISKSKFLNDIAVDVRETVYVSDTLNNVIYAISAKGEIKKFLSGPQTEGPNGLLVEGGDLLIAGWGKKTKSDFSSETPGRLLKVNLMTKEIKAVTPEPFGHLDGLEKDQHGDWILSDWMAGKIIHVDGSGGIRDLIALHQGTADIGFVPKDGLVIVPQMKESTVTAYRLK